MLMDINPQIAIEEMTTFFHYPSFEPRRFLAATCLFCPVGCLVNCVFVSGT
jgi:hypothetical protein